jgi:hypothetical protein
MGMPQTLSWLSATLMGTCKRENFAKRNDTRVIWRLLSPSGSFTVPLVRLVPRRGKGGRTLAAGISLRQIAAAERVSYSLVCRWAKQDGWLIVRRAHKAAGIPALYHYGAVQAFLADRHNEQVAA